MIPFSFRRYYCKAKLLNAFLFLIGVKEEEELAFYPGEINCGLHKRSHLTIPHFTSLWLAQITCKNPLFFYLKPKRQLSFLCVLSVILGWSGPKMQSIVQLKNKNKLYDSIFRCDLAQGDVKVTHFERCIGWLYVVGVLLCMPAHLFSISRGLMNLKPSDDQFLCYWVKISDYLECQCTVDRRFFQKSPSCARLIRKWLSISLISCSTPYIWQTWNYRDILYWSWKNTGLWSKF